LLDAYQFSVASGTSIPDPSYAPAEYTIDAIDNDGYIDGITIDPPGTWTQAVADINRRNSMYAYIGTNIQEPFNPANWVTIPFIVDSKANDVEYEFEGGGDTDRLANGDFSVYLQSNGSLVIPIGDRQENDVRYQGAIVSENESSHIFMDVQTDSPGNVYGGMRLETWNSVPIDIRTRAGGQGNDIKNWRFDSNGSITFPDGSIQTTAYTGGSGSSTVVRQDTAPTTSTNGTLWFNTVEARMYIKYNDQWVDSSPVIIPPPQTELDVNSITFADATTLTSAYTSKLVNGDNELVLGTDGTLTFPSGNLSISSIQGQEAIMGSTNTGIGIVAQGETGSVSLVWGEGGLEPEEGSNIAAVIVNGLNDEAGAVQIWTGDVGPETNIWKFGPDGTTKFPNGVIRPPLGDNTTTIESENSLTSLTVGNSSVTITAQTSTEYTWTFSTNGNLTFPDNTVQTTAYTGSNIQGEYIYEFDGTNTDLTIANVNFNLLFCKVANAYSGSATHNVNLPAGTLGQRLVIINISTNCTLTVAGFSEGIASVTNTSGPAEFIYTSNEGWFPMYGVYTGP
jgi:hypothetical protein